MKNLKHVPTIFADFNNADPYRRLRLNTAGTLDSLKKADLELKEGMQVLLDDEDSLITLGIVKYSTEEDIWVAEIDWQNLQHI